MREMSDEAFEGALDEARRLAAEVKNGRLTQAQALAQSALYGAAMARRENRRDLARLLLPLVILALIGGIALAVARSAAAAAIEPVPCRWCPPIQCLTQSICGKGCSCVKAGGSSLGQCMSIESGRAGR